MSAIAFVVRGSSPIFVPFADAWRLGAELRALGAGADRARAGHIVDFMEQAISSTPPGGVALNEAERNDVFLALDRIRTEGTLTEPLRMLRNACLPDPR
jgi:hypothetical protein